MNSTPVARILIVDDEVTQMRALRDTLRDQGYETAGFTTGEDALRALEENQFDLLLTDLMMPGMDGVALLAAALKIDPHLVGIIMTGEGTIATAVQAMQAGALDYILKPFKVSAILPVLARAVTVRRLRLENLDLRDTVAIHELNQAIAHTLDPNVLLDKIADAALAQFEADEVSIMLLTDDGRFLYVAAVRGGRRDTLLGTRMPIGDGIAGWVTARRETLVLEGEVRDRLPAPLYPRAEIQSAMCMPMIMRDRLIGVLNVNCIRKRRAFTLGQIRVLSIFTNAAAAGIEAARLYEDQRKADARYREVLHMAADGIISIDEEQRIVVFNGGAERLFGYRTEEALGKPLDMLLPAEAAGAHRRHVRSFGQGPDQSRAMAARDRLFGRRRDGTLFPVEAGISKHSENGKTLYTAVVRDITERRRAEQAMRDYTGQLRQLSLRMFEAEENERRRLARELHDRIGQNVTALSLNLNMVRGELPEDCRHKVKTRLDDCESLLYQTAQLVRNVLVNLRPPGLDDLGLVAALKEHARQVAERTGVSAAVIGTEIVPRLPPATETTLFRIAQEALNNIAKHARATEVSVTLEAGPDTVVLTVADNGRGFDTTARLVQPTSSLGMVSMRERAESIGARLHIESAPGKGTRVIVEAPRADQNASSPPHAPGIEPAQDLGTWSPAKNNRKDEQ
jgi:PAS domain S-box-containing protein